MTPARPVPTVLISIRWPAPLFVTDMVPETAPLMARFRLELGCTAVDSARGVESPLFPVPRHAAVLLAERRPHLDLVTARSAADSKRQIRACRSSIVISSARDLLSLALVEVDLAIAAPTSHQPGERAFGTGLGSLPRQHQTPNERHKGDELMLACASHNCVLLASHTLKYEPHRLLEAAAGEVAVQLPSRSSQRSIPPSGARAPSRDAGHGRWHA